MSSRMRACWWLMPVAVLAGLMIAAPVAAKPQSQNSGKSNRIEKLDRETKSRSLRLLGTSRVIIMLKPGQEANGIQAVKRLGGHVWQELSVVNALAIELPNRVIAKLAERSEVISIHYDRPTQAHLNRAAVTVGARAVRSTFGYDGAGIGVAVIDSGITQYHDDLGYDGTSTKVRVVAGQRVTKFVDFVNNGLAAYDDNGHGTHVSGIIAGNGADSAGARAGIAPAAHIVSLKVLDAHGRGVISDVIAAFGWAVANRTAHNIRVINLSVGARVTESYWSDPLTLAAKRATDAGIVVVTAAGNLGKKADGSPLYGTITAPGNAPWVLTVGASSTEGTPQRWDDKIAPYSSRGPSAVDYEAKPDLVAPGTGMVSLSAPGSTFYQEKASYLLYGSNRSMGYKPYLSLSGTSMASPVVAGTVALMLQANPNLTPNLVKAILQYTAQRYHYDALTQGAGFLNSYGAVELARFYARARVGDRSPSSWQWSKTINWGSHRITGGVLKPNGSAWALNIVWGTVDDENIVWGTQCGGDCENIVWGTMDTENIVWGTAADMENIVWGTLDDGENIVWGTLADVENIVWGTTCGGGDCENIVWGTMMDLENIVWGTAIDAENIVWGTAAGILNGVIWGSAADGEDVTWGSSGEDSDLFDANDADPITFDSLPLEELFGLLPPAGSSSETSTTNGGTLEGAL